MTAEALVEMSLRPAAVAESRERCAQALVCLRMIGIDFQRTLVVFSCVVQIAALQEQVGQVAVPDCVLWMVSNRFRINAARGRGESSGHQNVGQFVQRAEVRWRLQQDFDESLVRICLAPKRVQKDGALDPRLDGRLVGGDKAVEIAKSLLLRHARRPDAGLGHGVLQIGKAINADATMVTLKRLY